MKLGTAIEGRFQVGAVVGAGGVGTVHRGRDLATGTDVAIKLLNQDVDVERFAREAALLARLDDPHVVKYVAHGTADGTPYLVMEWIEGPTVQARIVDVGFDAVESLALTFAIARGLAAAHRIGIVHRDIKPSNVLLPSDDPARACLVDFGLGRAYGEGSTLTRTGTVLGTPGYMAPEQALARRSIDARADLFALGAILYECLVGRPAFSGGDAAAIHCKVIAFEPPSIASVRPDLPPIVSELGRRLLAKDPELRPADANALLKLLARIQVPAGGPRRAQRPRPAQVIADQRQPHARPARFVVLAKAPVDDEGFPVPPEAEATARAEAACRAAGTELCELVDGGWMAVVHDDDAINGARWIARLARELVAAAPSSVLVIAGGPDDGKVLDTILDVGSAALDLGLREAVFGASPAPPGSIRLDRYTAELLVTAAVPEVATIGADRWLLPAGA